MAAILKNGCHFFPAEYRQGSPPRSCAGRSPEQIGLIYSLYSDYHRGDHLQYLDYHLAWGGGGGGGTHLQYMWCVISSRYPYEVGDHMNSQRSKKNTREAEFQVFHHFFGGGGGKEGNWQIVYRFEA